MENHCNVGGFLGWYFFNKSLSILIVCHHDLHTLLKRWRENKILHFLDVFFFCRSVPKEKRHLMCYSLYNVKFSFRLCSWTSDFTQLLLVLCKLYGCASLLVQAALWSDLICSSNHSGTVMARNVTFQFQALPQIFFAVSNYYVIAVCILAWPGLHTFKIGVWGVWGGFPLYNRPRCIWMTANVSTLEHLSAFKFLSGRCLCMVPSLSNRVCLENLQHFLNLFQDLCCLFFSNLQYGVIWTDTVWSSFFSEPPPLTDFFVTSFLCSRSIARI